MCSLPKCFQSDLVVCTCVRRSSRHPIETVNGKLQDATGLTTGESVVEVIIKRLDEKQYHPQEIEDDRYNTHNDDVDGHSKYPLFLHWNSSARKSVVSVNRAVSRIDRLTDGKLVHGVMPCVLEHVLLLDESISPWLGNEIR